MNDRDVRWIQRFNNFSRAYALLRDAIQGRNLMSDLEKEGAAHRFEFTFELAWKTLRDYLEEDGVSVLPATARNAIKTAFAAGILPDGQVWIDMLLHRNLLAHTYDSLRLDEVLNATADRYLPAFTQLHEWLLQRRVDA